MTAVEVRNLRKRYGSRVAVDDVSFTVEEGEILGIVGPNGAGKTTTVECVEGLRRPDAGSVRVLGLDPVRDGSVLRERLGVQLQGGELPENLRVGEALRLYGSLYRQPMDAHRLMADLGLLDSLHTPYGKLSGGQKQRLSIALALVGNPEVVVLDELTTGLDPVGRRETWRLVEQVRDRGVTVLLVTHFMDEAERLCDRVAVFNSGRIVALDTPTGLIAHADAEQRIWFRPSAPLDERLLQSLPEVRRASRRNDLLELTGTGNLLPAVSAALSSRGIAANDLRVQVASLEDAYVALTGRPWER